MPFFQTVLNPYFSGSFSRVHHQSLEFID